MIRLVGVELTKVRTTRLWIGLLLGAVGLVLLGTVFTLALAGSQEGREAGLTPIESAADVRDFVVTGGVAGVFALVIGATSMTTEHRHRTLSGTFLATPTRWPVVIAKVASSAVIGLGFGLVGALIPLVAAVVVIAARGDGFPVDTSVWLAVAAVGAGTAFSAAMGAAVGAALRSQLVAILGVLGWALVVESLIGAVVPASVKWFPFTGLTNGLAQAGAGDLFSPAISALLMAAYLGLGLAVGIAVTRGRDVD